MHRPQWTLHVLWHHDDLSACSVEALPGHSALIDAAHRLARDLPDDMR